MQDKLMDSQVQEQGNQCSDQTEPEKKITEAQIIISYKFENGMWKVGLSGELPGDIVIADGVMERARFIMRNFFLRKAMEKQDEANLRQAIMNKDLKGNIKTGWLKRFLR